MTPHLALTSIPAWAATPTRPLADLTGRTWTIVSFDADVIVRGWAEQLGGSGHAVRIHRVATDAEARAVLTDDIATAVVGWRLMLAGPADACLRLRALAIQLGVADDELVVATTDVNTRDVHCAHCGVTTTAEVGVEQVVACRGCGRKLFVYYHVSRRLGAHLGFMADVERSESVTS